jgi:GxxExxY protein
MAKKATAEFAKVADPQKKRAVSAGPWLASRPGIDEKERLNELSRTIIGAAIAVHRQLGPGLLESAYEACFAYELTSRRLSIECQKPVPLAYGNVLIDCAYRIDVLVEREVVVEVKAVEKITRVHEAQTLLYMRLARSKLGLLINFNVKWLVDQGIRRFVKDFPE